MAPAFIHEHHLREELILLPLRNVVAKGTKEEVSGGGPGSKSASRGGLRTESTEADWATLLKNEGFEATTLSLAIGTAEGLRSEKDPNAGSEHLMLRCTKVRADADLSLRTWEAYEHKQLLGRWIDQF